MLLVLSTAQFLIILVQIRVAFDTNIIIERRALNVFIEERTAIFIKLLLQVATKLLLEILVKSNARDEVLMPNASHHWDDFDLRSHFLDFKMIGNE